MAHFDWYSLWVILFIMSIRHITPEVIEAKAKLKAIQSMEKSYMTNWIYHVYLLRVDCKLTYYGVTSNYNQRKKEHRNAVDGIIRERVVIKPDKKVLNRLSVHYEIAYYLSKYKTKIKRNSSALQFDVCYTTNSLKEAKEVESFLIKMAKKGEHCCNVRN